MNPQKRRRQKALQAAKDRKKRIEGMKPILITQCVMSKVSNPDQVRLHCPQLFAPVIKEGYGLTNQFTSQPGVVGFVLNATQEKTFRRLGIKTISVSWETDAAELQRANDGSDRESDAQVAPTT